MNGLKTALNGSLNSAEDNKLDKSIKKVTSSMGKLIKLSVVWAGMKKVYTNLIQPSIDLVETTNLFEVSMGKVVDEYGKLDEVSSKYYTKAIAFQEKMNEKLATNQKEVMEYQAKYFSMFKNQGIDLDNSYFMSENLTKAGYDIASLYNLTTSEAMEKIRAGIAGQVEPLRAIGVDISESALEKVLNEAGIERSVQELSYAEKEVARYIAIVDQAKQAQGDFAKTFESPANQVRVFKNQLEELRQVAGSFFTGVFGNVLVYVNAIIMVLKEILKSFANLFGIELSIGSVNEGVEDVSDSLGDATKKAKEFKKQLMGFDEINNITLQDKDSSGSGSSATGIDEKLLKSLKEWDNKMESISGKAQEIRDKMLAWLGFVRNDDGTWKLKEGLTNFEKIKDTVKNIGIAFGTWKVSSAITKLLNALGILKKGQAFKIAFGLTLALSGIYAQYKGTEHLLNGDADLFTILETLLGTAGGTFGIVSLLNASKTGKALPLKNKIGIGAGIMFLLQGIQATVDGITKDNFWSQIWGSLEIGLGAGLLMKSPQAGLNTALLVFDVTLAFQMIKWAFQNFDESKERIYGDLNKKLNPFQAIYVALDAIGTGVIENWIGEEAIQPVIDWVADVMIWFRKLGIDIKYWWQFDVAPWFTKEKWQAFGENMKTGLANKWEEFKNWWGNTAIVKWWNENVSPWFTKEKWQNVANNAKLGIEAKFNEWKNAFSPISNWWNTKIAPWFTKAKWQTLGNEAVKGIQSAFSNFNFKIKLPHFTWTSTPAKGWIADTLSALNLPVSIPKLNVSWYANGGMPDMGEIFVARESGPEMVGKIGNKTTVANNDQIVTAIQQGVYTAVMNAMASGSNEVHLDIRADEGIIVKKASQGFKDYVMQTGELPFPVPV